MTSRHKESVTAKEKRGVSLPMSSGSTPTERRKSLRPATPPAGTTTTTVTRDHGKAPAASSSATNEPRKHVPNYLKPTISSNPDAAKQSTVRKLHAHDESHKAATPTMMRRRSFDRPVPASPRTLQSSSARGERTTPPFSPKHSGSATVTRPASSSSSERTSKVVKAMKSQPPLLKTTKSMPRASASSGSSSGVKKEGKSSNLKKPTPLTKEVRPPLAEEEPVHVPNTIESEAEDHESLDLNVEEELAKMESPVDLPPPENHFAEDKEHIDEENQRSKEHEDENKEALNNVVETTVSEDHQDEHDHTPEPVTEVTENVEVIHDETHVVPEETQVTQVNETPVEDNYEDIEVVQQSHHTDENDHEHIQPVNEAPAEDNEDIQVVQQIRQHTDENDKQHIQPVNEAPAEDNDTKEEEEREKDTIEEIKPAELTVKTTPDDEMDDIHVIEKQAQLDSEGVDEQQNPKEETVHKIDEEKKPANTDAQNVVHKRQVGGSRNKKESQAYNDVIEETASRLVEKRVNKVRALAGAFETVISLQQPDSS